MLMELCCTSIPRFNTVQTRGGFCTTVTSSVLHHSPIKVSMSANESKADLDFLLASIASTLKGKRKQETESLLFGNNNKKLRLQPLSVTGLHGKSKKEAHRNAILAVGEVLPVSEEYNRLIKASPEKRITALHVPGLSNLAKSVLDAALGPLTERLERQEHLKDTKESWFEAQREKAGRLRSPSRRASRQQHSDVARGRLNERLTKEQQARYQRATAEPESDHGKMQAVRDALPILAIRDRLVEALQTEPVVVVSGGTGTGM
jgi:hypothetical protein